MPAFFPKPDEDEEPLNNYFFFDGSALLSDLKRFQQTEKPYVNRKLMLDAFVGYYASLTLNVSRAPSHRRATFYFARGESRIDGLLQRPQPGACRDLRMEMCGKRVPRAERAQAWLDEHGAPQEVLESLHRSEKAVDTQICCDALQLAATGKLDRLLLYANDYDFVPLVRSLRQLGCNTNLLRLSAENVNQDLVSECDGLAAMPESYYPHLFAPLTES